jgi:predicted PurR-regulated permease PerM
MGFTGVLIAVPLAAVLGVLIRFAVTQYKNSALYKDPLAPNKP